MQTAAAPARFAFAVLLLGAVLISFSGIFVKLSDAGPTMTGFYRMFLPLPVFWALMIAERRGAKDPATRAPAKRTMGRAAWLAVFWSGFFLAADLIAWHWSLKFIPVATATLLGNTAPFWVALAGFVLFGERFATRFLVGLAIAFLGMALLVLGGEQGLEITAQSWLGVVLGIIAAIGYAGYLRGVKEARRTLPTAQTMFWGAVFAAIFLLPVGLATEDAILPQSPQGWGAVIGLALVSQVAGQGLIGWALAHLPAAFSSVSLLVNPVAAALFAWLTLGEALSLPQIIGGLCVLAGIFAARGGTRPGHDAD